MEFIVLAEEMIKLKQPIHEHKNPKGRKSIAKRVETSAETHDVTRDNLKTALEDNNRVMMEAMVKAIQASKSPKRSLLSRQDN